MSRMFLHPNVLACLCPDDAGNAGDAQNTSAGYFVGPHNLLEGTLPQKAEVSQKAAFVAQTRCDFGLRAITIIVRSDMMLVGWRVPLQRFTSSSIQSFLRGRKKRGDLSPMSRHGDCGRRVEALPLIEGKATKPNVHPLMLAHLLEARSAGFCLPALFKSVGQKTDQWPGSTHTHISQRAPCASLWAARHELRLLDALDFGLQRFRGVLGACEEDTGKLRSSCLSQVMENPRSESFPFSFPREPRKPLATANAVAGSNGGAPEIHCLSAQSPARFEESRILPIYL